MIRDYMGHWHMFKKQFLDEVEHDMMNYQNRGLSYRLPQITQTRTSDNS